MSRYFLSIGSNIDPEKNIPACISLLRKMFNALKISSVYETEPVGPAGDKKFWNFAAEIESDLSREELSKQIKQAEESLGRTRENNKFAPRTIDIDLLPQAEYQNQGFIIVPLAKIAPEALDPETGKSFSVLRKELKETGIKRIS